MKPAKNNNTKYLYILFLLIFCLMYPATNAAQTGNDNKYNSVEYSSLPPLPVGCEQGVSAPYAGIIGDALIVAGGCNFPDALPADGGTKRFYDTIYMLANPLDKNAQWQIAGTLPQAAAYGVSITLPDGVVCIGGQNSENSLDDVFLIKLVDGKTDITPLATLPVKLFNMGGAYGNGYIYIAGGQTDAGCSLSAYRLKYPGGTAWEKLPDIPGEGRLQPAAVVQNGNTAPLFYLLGGYKPTDDTNGYTHTNGLIYNPQTGTWKETAPMIVDGDTLALVGASATASGCTHIVCTGGVNRNIFENAINSGKILEKAEAEGDTVLAERIKTEIATYQRHEPEWYKFRNELLIYHTITDTWVTESQSPLLARAGAALVPYKDSWIVVGGETKPGVRSADITAVEMSVRTEFGLLNWIVLIAYLVGMLLLGYYFMRRESNSEDFFKGGGRIPWWAAGISIYATMLSAITYMAYPAKAFATDWTYYPMLITILLMSFPVIKYYLPFFRRLNVTSAYEYLEHRFNAATRLMSSALFIIFMVARMALVLYLPSLALTAVTGIDIYICIVLMGLITIIYCTMGGVEAVVWGDVIQGFILVGGALFAVGYLVLGTEGGIGGCIDIAIQDDKLRLFDWSLDYRSATFWVIIIGGMANNLISYTSDQTVIQRYLTTKDEKSARQSILMNGVMSVFISVAFFAIGTGLYTFFKTHPAAMDYTMAKADTIFPFFMMSQLPAGIAGLLIAAIFAATMSTISSNINSVATAFSIDFYRRWFPNTSDKGMLKVARYACLVSGILGVCIALLMATWQIFSLLDFFQEILGLLSSGLGGLFVMGIFFPRIKGRAALTGFLSGVAAVFCVKYFTATNVLIYGAIGIVVSVSVAYLFSFVLKEERDLNGLTWRTLKKEEK